MKDEKGLTGSEMDYKDYYRDNRTYITQGNTRIESIITITKELEPQNLLDVGCGNGYLLSQLSSCTTSVLQGVDVYDLMPEGWSYTSADITAGLPFGNSGFDMVILGEVIEHVPNPDFLLEEIWRVLQPCGWVIITTPNLASWTNRILLAFGIQPLFTETSSRTNLGRRFKILGQGNKAQGHLKVFTSRSLKELVVLSGFEVKRTHGVPFSFPFPFSLVDRLFSRKASFASGVLLLAQKPA